MNAYIHTIHKYGCLYTFKYICTYVHIVMYTFVHTCFIYAYIHIRITYRVYTYMHGDEDIINLYGGVVILWYLLL